MSEIKMLRQSRQSDEPMSGEEINDSREWSMRVMMFMSEVCVREGFFLVPVSPPVRFDGAENCVFFWTGDFV